MVLLACVAGSLVATPVFASPEEQRLGETRQRLAEVREQIEEARERRDDDAESLAEAEAQLQVVLEAVHAAELAVQRQEESVEHARRELERLEEEAGDQEQLMASRAATLYRRGTGVPFAAVIAADSLDDALQRSVFVEVLARADRTMLETIEVTHAQIEQQREQLQAEQETLERVYEEREAILAEVRALRDERALVLADTEEKLQELEAQERYLESESRELAALSRRASRVASSRGGGHSSTAVSADGWVWPAQGPITSEFGLRWGRVHEGIDIGAGQGAPVQAARGGVVAFAGRMGGYGNLMLVDHGGGIVTAYAHLSGFQASVGQSVSAGERIASVGCTGSCTGPHLHFEVRVNGAAHNPRAYLP